MLTRDQQTRWKLSTQRQHALRRMNQAQCITVSVEYGFCFVVTFEKDGSVTDLQDRDDTNMFHMFERYKGKAAFDAHNAQPIIQRLLNEWRYIRGVKAWFPPAKLASTIRLPTQ